MSRNTQVALKPNQNSEPVLDSIPKPYHLLGQIILMLIIVIAILLQF